MRYKVFLVWLFSIGSFFPGLCQDDGFPAARQLGFALPDEYSKATIPFQIYNNLIVIDVLLNQSLPLKFVLDTGVRTTVLTEKSLSDLLNLQYSRKITIPGIGGEKLVNAFVVNDVSLNIGEIEGNGHALLVLEKDLLQLKNYLGVNVHGILGYELFSRFVVDINYDNKIINFYRPTDYTKKGRYRELDITIEDTKPYVDAKVFIREKRGNLDGKFMIDTGASHTLLLNCQSSPEVYVPEPNVATTLGRGLGGDIHGDVARIDRVELSDFEFEGVISTFPDLASYEISFEDFNRNGTMGGGMMSRFHVIFDYANNKLYLKKGRQFRKPFEFNLSGIIVKAAGVYLRKFEVENVRKNSSAEAAGIKPGDHIINVNGISTSKLNLDELIGKLNEKANRRIRIIVIRDGKTKTFDFRLHRLI